MPRSFFKIRGQKKEKDVIQGQISPWTLKHVINVKTLFLVVIHMNYLNCYFLFIYKLTNEQIKQATCIPRLSRHAWVITLFYFDLVTFQYKFSLAEFLGPSQVRTKDKNFAPARKRSDNFGPSLEWNTKSWPDQNSDPQLFNLFLFCQPGLRPAGKINSRLQARLKNHLLFAGPDTCR